MFRKEEEEEEVEVEGPTKLPLGVSQIQVIEKSGSISKMLLSKM